MPSSSDMPSLAAMFPEEIARALDIPPYRGRQIFQWLHQRRIHDPNAMTDLPKPLRTALAQLLPETIATVLEKSEDARAGATKLLLALQDGQSVEAVLLRHKDHVTFCVSSQAGCALGCRFCATGQAGFRRHLSAEEITEQVHVLSRESGIPEDATPNVVYMGMGEPFQNYDAVARSIRLLHHDCGMHIGARKITVSTVGDVEGIRKFSREEWQVRLSVSLHAADNRLRSRLLPINRRFPLERLREALLEYQRHTRRQFTIEWTLMDGINDTSEQARALVDYLRGLDVSINLIPWNEVPELPFRASPPGQCRQFADLLAGAGLKATLRAERGAKIHAACGQLRGIRPAQIRA